jgi:hypothetical protein
MVRGGGEARGYGVRLPGLSSAEDGSSLGGCSSPGGKGASGGTSSSGGAIGVSGEVPLCTSSGGVRGTSVVGGISFGGYPEVGG